MRASFSTAVCVGLLLVISWPFLLSLSDATRRIQWFHLTDDEAQHTELIARLSETGKYGEWAGPPFAPRLTTGPALVVPASGLRALTGMPPSYAGRLTSFAYHFLALVILCLIALQWAKPRPFTRTGKLLLIFSALGVFHLAWRAQSETGYYNYGVLGEGPGAALTLLTFYLSMKRLSLFAGFAAGLAVLAKPTFIFLPIALFVYECLRFFKNRKESAPIYTLIGIAFPGSLWIGWMIHELGPQGTLEHWIRFPSLMRKVNHGGIPIDGDFSPLRLISGVWDHIVGIPVFMKARGIILSLLGFGMLAWGVFRNKTFLNWLYLPLLFATFHFAWWFFLSPGAQARYLFPGLIPCWMACVLFAITMGSRVLERVNTKVKLKPEDHPYFEFTVGIAGILVAVFALEVFESWKDHRNNFDNCGHCRQIEIQNFWKGLEERPALVYSTSSKADKELFLSAPYSYHTFDPLNRSVHPPKGSWVSVGDFAREGTEEFLAYRRCQPIFVLPGRKDGFWRCP